ncbi:hypothetical protein OIU85_014021 [Salix viminalis]|uniref:Uncharacterized protein n=1 Tax=Salix viminalis TaxID=40686 RepID=A0A9Q0NMW1_SALVM|nr:hypothetical protein OIU85_014021 [Salix viminalis]
MCRRPHLMITFKPINKQAEIIMKTQLEGEENSMKDMMKAMQTRALLEKLEAERKANVNGADAETKANVNDADANQINQETGSHHQAARTVILTQQ